MILSFHIFHSPTRSWSRLPFATYALRLYSSLCLSSHLPLTQVMDIAEVVFSGVPKKHHLNCGFSIVAFHPTTQQQLSINLLTETPEDMRYWVHALRYIKAYWSKMQVGC